MALVNLEKILVSFAEKTIMAMGTQTRKIIFLFITLAVAVGSFKFGYHLLFHDPNRLPAGLARAHDFSNLSQSEADRAIRNRIIEGLRFVQVGPNEGYELGAFYARDSEGQTQFVCDQYPRISMKYTADGMAVSGSLPELTISGPCLTSDYEQTIVALLVPFHKLNKLQAKDGQVKMDNIQLQFRHMSDEWPATWVLTEIVLAHPTKGQLRIDRDEIKNVKGKNLSIEVPL